jgi:pimeloyl-ACP methyl ester carboxylesterase
MGLTDALTFYLFAALALSATLLTLIFWKKIYRPKFPNFVLRFFIIILCQILTLLSIGVGINRSQGFYESWGDLFGTTPLIATSATISPTLITEKEINKGEKLASHSVLMRDVIEGKESKVANVVYLDLPSAAIDEIKNKFPLDPQRFHIVQFLTGFPSQPIMWVRVLKIDQALAFYNASHVGHEIIGVFPQINISGSYDLECMNLPNGKPAAETWLSTDIHNYVEQRLGIPSSRWGVMGVSTGGWCSAMLSIRHPDLFSAAASIAGYYRPALPRTYPIELQKSMNIKYDLDASESALTATLPLYVTASLGDTYSIKETRKFLAKQHDHLAITYRELPSGGHNSRVWVSLIPGAVEWLGQNIIS